MAAVYVDTSALVALFLASDRSHETAARAFARLADEGAPLYTSSYVVVETCALLDRRVGREAVLRFRSEFAPLLRVLWVDEELHEAGLDRLVGQRGAGLSFVDATSLAAMRRLGLERAFAFDELFSREGYDLVN